MQLPNKILTLEKTLEKQVLTFFITLGAGEAPESWQQESADEPVDDKHDAGGTERH